MQQIDLEVYDIFRNHLSTFHDTSASDDTPPVYVCNSEKKVVDFDEVTKEYCKIELSKSVDALGCMDRKLHFVEFKGGRVQSESKRNAIYGKAKYSQQIFCAIVGMDIECFKKNASFILVYDLGKNPSLLKNEQYIDGESVSKLRFHEYFSSKAKQKPKMFNIKDLQGSLYEKVDLCKKEDFEDKAAICSVGFVADIA